ncbi:thiamine pyrophosphate-binding protein [Butyrivibrio sp. CB08]|uniref:thiamine pyrophosphate-binding protein n=1 Tax=Butyrivibrio sp. CB08 TaxID=2364879 RepID=UPI000EA8C5D7|nr:thiamine pyrophosphate-binding protein [Butyrivibrio sp. CB08]RKM60418.1 thiamine pyrophosphate-binding protein [Butyrivibrio sp. CB08]
MDETGMNVSEYIVKYIEYKEIDKLFGIVGGASLWLCKAFGDSNKIEPVFTNHEQAAVMAAEGWARMTGKPGIVLTINGPGMTNTVTGIAQAWTDSAPIILLTGNSNLQSVKFERENNLRQYGTQDVRTDIIMQGITKKTILLEAAEDVKDCMDEAFRLATEGRPGPVVIEVPINIQSSEVPEGIGFGNDNTNDNSKFDKYQRNIPTSDYDKILNKLKDARRPLILAGQGVRLSGAVKEFREFIYKYDIPVVNSRMGIDSITSNDRHFVGRCGNHGDRASHFALQTCDVLLVLGCRLAPNATGYDVTKFSQQSYKMMIEIDPTEKVTNGIPIDDIVMSDLADFIYYALKKTDTNSSMHEKWVKCCNDWKYRYPVVTEKYYNNESISTYRVVDIASKLATEDDLILSDTGSCCSILAQAWNVKANQRVFISGGLSAMGYYVTTMGLALANNDNNRNVICFVGDGSFQMNIQELATIAKYQLPIKVIIISNKGYQFVRMSQGAYGINPPFGTDIEYGVPIPDIGKIVEAYGLHYSDCRKAEELENSIRNVLNSKAPEVLEIFVDRDQEVCPRLKSVAKEDGTFVSPEFANLYPFLGEEVLTKELQKADEI